MERDSTVPAHDQAGNLPTYEEAVGVDEALSNFRATQAPTNGIYRITCHVCQTSTDLTCEFNDNVLLCSSCSEVTPVKAAPPGKRYIRCPCNALLVTEFNTLKLKCPRESCRRFLTLPPSKRGVAASSPISTAANAAARCPTDSSRPSTSSGRELSSSGRTTSGGQNSIASILESLAQLPPLPAPQGFNNIECGNCKVVFMLNSRIINGLVCSRNPRCVCGICGKSSVIGRSATSWRIHFYVTFGILFLLTGTGLGISIAVGTLNKQLAVVLMAPFLGALVSFMAGCYWKFGITVSKIVD